MNAAALRLSAAVFETFMLAAFALIGVFGLVTPSTRARSIVATFPVWAQLVWYVGLLLASAAALYGIARGADNGLLIERTGLIFLAGLSMSYATASVTVTGAPALTGALLLGAFAVACIIRARDITRTITALQLALKQQ